MGPLPRGSKLPDHQANPLDVALERLSREAVVPWLRATGHTPNVITAYSFACGLVALVHLARGRIGAFGLWLTLSYFFDVVDGQFARSFDMVTHVGDILDHGTDAIVAVGCWALLAGRHGVLPATALFLPLLLGNVLMFGCQQQNCPPAPAESLDRLRAVCPDRRWVRVTRFLGGGTGVLIIILGSWALERRRTLAALGQKTSACPPQRRGWGPP